MINKVYICGYAFNLASESTLDDFEVSVKTLKDFLESDPVYNRKAVNTDLFDLEVSDDGALQDILIAIATSTSNDISNYLFTAINEVINHYLSDINTTSAIEEANQAQRQHGEFVSFYSQTKAVPGVSADIHINSKVSLFNLNYKNLGEFPVSSQSFTHRAKLLFDNILFDDNFETTLLTVKNKDFTVYSIEFAKALKALSLAEPELSNLGNNVSDLELIHQKTALAGRVMECTPQGSNKSAIVKKFKATLKNGEIISFEKLNCEYHLKINHNNQGQEVSDGHYNRAYFGLPILKNKKHIALLHLGCHQ